MDQGETCKNLPTKVAVSDEVANTSWVRMTFHESDIFDKEFKLQFDGTVPIAGRTKQPSGGKQKRTDKRKEYDQKVTTFFEGLIKKLAPSMELLAPIGRLLRAGHVDSSDAQHRGIIRKK